MPVSIVRELPSVDVATRIASLGFVQPNSPALRADVDDHLSQGKIVFSVVDAKTAETVGFAIFLHFDWSYTGMSAPASTLYLSGIILDPAYQGMGIAAMAVAEAQAITGAKFLALRTQSPRMWSAGAGMTTDWFPHPRHETPVEMSVRGLGAALRMDSSFPVARGIYKGPLYGAKPVHRDAALQTWWDSICDFTRGDAVFCIGTLPPIQESH
jgi:hypothetical protein